MPHLCDRNSCTGCSACASICPQQCIRMLPDAEGFLRPTVDEERCVGCELCSQSCPVLNAPEVPEALPQAFAAQNTDDGLRRESTSGGVFTLLAEQILKQGGAVFGAVYDENLRVVHRRADTVEQLAAMRGAKYAQSDPGSCFREVRTLLSSGKPVLFSGTPCETAGLKSYIGGDNDRLWLVDLICHGVPSPAVFAAYLRDSGRAHGGEAPVSVNLRCKDTGWAGYSVDLRWANGGRQTRSNREDPFIRSFVGDLSLRPSCYSCPFKGLSRSSDITLGDYWGVWEQMPKLSDDKGTSIVLLHSEKAKQLWPKLAGAMRCQPADVQTCMAQNPAATRPPQLDAEKRQAFFSRYANEDFSALTKELLPPPGAASQLIHRVGSKLKRMLKH